MRGVNGVHHITCYCRAGAGESRFLRRRARHATRQAQRQPGRSRHLSSVLRGCRGPSRIGPDLLSVGARWRRHAPDMGSPWRSASKCRTARSTSGARVSRTTARRAPSRRGSVRRCSRSSIRTAWRWRSSKPAPRGASHRGWRAGAGRTADPRPVRRAALGTRCLGHRGLPHLGPRLPAAGQRARLDALRLSQFRRHRRCPRCAGCATRRVGRRQRASSRVACR